MCWCFPGLQFDFVVHGLWPQSDRGNGAQGQPRACRLNAGGIKAATVRQHLCTVPGPRLMQNEWQAHGTCGWPTPEAYFNQIETLRARYTLPTYADLVTDDQPVTAGQIKDAFVRLNPGKLTRANLVIDAKRLRVTQASKKRNKANTLKEVKLCLDTAFDPIPCRETGTLDETRVTITPPRSHYIRSNN
jgi:ribonuclease T2